MGHHGQIVFPSLPENLVSKPTLMWLLRNAATAPQRVEASYLTGGITWKADYVVILNAADDRADLTGWVTIDNKSGATYRDAALKLVAGDVNRARDDRTRQAMEMAAKSVAAAPASRDFVSEGFFEYHLYTLDGRTTIKDKQTKQLTLMSAAGVPVRKELAFFGARDYYRTQYGTPMSNQKVSVFVELTNAKANNLGVPLPKGKIRVYKADKSGSQQLVGEDWIDHTPKDERVRIKMGEAFDVVGERTQRDWKKIGGSTYEVEWEISLRNHKKEDVVVSVIEPIPGDWEVLRETPAAREGRGPHAALPGPGAPGGLGEGDLPGPPAVLAGQADSRPGCSAESMVRAYPRKRSGSRRRRSAGGVAPPASWATSLPVAGPIDMPTMAWPAATTRLSNRRGRPTSGRPSGVHGRRPRQISRSSRLSPPSMQASAFRRRASTRRRLIERSIPASSSVPPNRRNSPIGVTEKRPSAGRRGIVGARAGRRYVRL